MSNKIQKLKKISDDKDYIKSEQTVTEKLSADEIQKLLEDYKKIDSNELKRGFHVRYFKINQDKSVEFKLGGNILKVNGLPEYIVLSNGKLNWSVQCKNTIFYQKMTFTEEKEEFNKIITKQNNDIQILTDYVKNLKSEIIEKDKLIKKFKNELKQNEKNENNKNC